MAYPAISFLDPCIVLMERLLVAGIACQVASFG